MRHRFPPRPALTIVFTSGALFWAACAAAYSTGDLRDPQLSVLLSLVASAVFACSLAVSALERVRVVGLALASVSVGVLLGSSQAAFIHSCSDAYADVDEAPAELVVIEDSVNYGFGENALVSARADGRDEAVFSAKFGDVAPMLAGERFSATVSFSSIDYRTDRFAWGDGACGVLKVRDVREAACPQPRAFLIGLRRHAIHGIGADDDAHALLQALVCGYRRNVRGTEMYAQFQACGLAHLVATSGAHLVIVTGLLAALMRRLRAPRSATIALSIAAMASYYVIAGMPVSALRAAVMSAAGLLAFFGKRRPSSLNAVGIGLFSIIASSPSSCVSASLALSALSTIGIVLFAPLAQAWLERTPLSYAPFALEALALTLSSSLLSQLYACSLFDQLPLVAPLANIVTAPLFTLACGAGLVVGLGGALFPWPTAFLESAAAALAALLAASAQLMAGLPYASIPFTLGTATALGVSASAAIALWAWWPHPRLPVALGVAAVSAALVLCLPMLASRGDRIVMFDVGQGDAILVQSRGQTLLIDTGNQDAMLLHELAANHIVHIDSVLVSHADDDHFGALPTIAETVDVSRAILARDMLACEDASARLLVEQAGRCADTTIGVEAGDSFAVGAFTARVIWPHALQDDGGNADSLCVLLEYDGDGDGAVDYRALMTGDAEKDELAAMIAEGVVGDIDILKVGHHGSRNGMTEDEARVLDPEIALISCGLHNRYGHPASETVDLLGAVGAQTFRTDLDGEIECSFSPGKVSVRCANR